MNAIVNALSVSVSKQGSSDSIRRPSTPRVEDNLRDLGQMLAKANLPRAVSANTMSWTQQQTPVKISDLREKSPDPPSYFQSNFQKQFHCSESKLDGDIDPGRSTQSETVPTTDNSSKNKCVFHKNVSGNGHFSSREESIEDTDNKYNPEISKTSNLSPKIPTAPNCPSLLL